MTSYKIDKLQKLVEKENIIKEKKRILMEEIELEIEKNRRLELESTITKLRTQVEELSKNIEGEIMPNNIEKNPYATDQSRKGQITVSEFIDNISHLSEQKIPEGHEQIYKGNDKILTTIPREIKIYHDMIPILTTIMGVLDKQQKEINNLKQ